MEKTKQGYFVRSYFKLMLNKLKVMGPHLYLYQFKDIVQKTFHGASICPSSKVFLKTTFKYNRTINEFHVNYTSIISHL